MAQFPHLARTALSCAAASSSVVEGISDVWPRPPDRSIMTRTRRRRCAAVSRGGAETTTFMDFITHSTAPAVECCKHM